MIQVADRTDFYETFNDNTDSLRVNLIVSGEISKIEPHIRGGGGGGAE